MSEMHLEHADLELVLRLAGALAHDEARERIALGLDHRRRRHPIQGLEAPGVVVDEHRAVGLEHDEPHGLRQNGGQAAGVDDLAAGDEQTHGRRTVPSLSDMSLRSGVPFRSRREGRSCHEDRGSRNGLGRDDDRDEARRARPRRDARLAHGRQRGRDRLGRGGRSAPTARSRTPPRFGELVFNCTAGIASLAALEAAGADNLAGKTLVDIVQPARLLAGLAAELTVCNTDSLASRSSARYPDTKVVKALNTMNASVMVDPSSSPASTTSSSAETTPARRRR